jgi:hypothetical protein
VGQSDSGSLAQLSLSGIVEVAILPSTSINSSLHTTVGHDVGGRSNRPCLIMTTAYWPAFRILHHVMQLANASRQPKPGRDCPP